MARTFEYDINIAITENEIFDGNMYIRMPYSAVLFLRSPKKTTVKMSVIIETMEGSLIKYIEPAQCLADYSLDNLIQKNLIFLFPFYMFNLEKEFPRYEKGDKKAENKVITAMNSLLQQTNSLLSEGNLSYVQYQLITDTLKLVTDALTRKYPKVRKELE